MLISAIIKAMISHFRMRMYVWRRNRTGLLSLAVNLPLWLLAWCFFPLEQPGWKKIREEAPRNFPQVDFDRPKLLDGIRIAVQAVFLCFYADSERGFLKRCKTAYADLSDWLSKLSIRMGQAHTDRYTKHIQSVTEGRREPVSIHLKSLALTLIAVAAGSLFLLCVTQPFDLTNQFIFLGVMWALAVVLKQIRSHLTVIFMFIISTIVSTRYLWWRFHETLNTDTTLSTFFSLLLVMSEVYAFVVMVLSYFQTCWVLDRKPYPLPEDRSLWPHVDIFIPTYNEPMEVVRPTVYGAMDMDWPTEKLHVYILDDGSREEFKEFAKTVGCGYIEREIHNHAKAGNINNAMRVTNSEFISIFDCDHVPTRSYLQMTVGWFLKDKKIALVQTPHHFYSEDPFERNLPGTKSKPFENALFHDFIQKGNDTWNATMFCGSCAIMRRVALEEINGIAVETVTEDAHTSLRLNRRGWTSAFISIPLAAGLATESLSAHIGQRIRWARGMVQIFRLDCPLLGKGLQWPQRLCFTNAMIHFMHGLPRIVFLLAPLPYMFADIYVILATAPAIFAFVVPHMVHSTMTNQVMQHGYRYPFLGAIYETVLSWYIFLPTLIALFMPHKGTFNVTVKGGIIDKAYFDNRIAIPYLILIGLNVLGLIVGVTKFCISERPSWEFLTLAINIGWILYNLVILGASMAVAFESIQMRRYPRVYVSIPVSLTIAGCYQVKATLTDYSQKGASVKILMPGIIERIFRDSLVHLVFDYNGRQSAFAARVRRVSRESSTLGLELLPMDTDREREYNRCTFCRTDTWSFEDRNGYDMPLWPGFVTVCRYGVMGFNSLAKVSPKPVRVFLTMTADLLNWIFSFLPRFPAARTGDK